VHVAFDSALGNKQSLPDLTVGQAVTHRTKNLNLAPCEQVRHAGQWVKIGALKQAVARRENFIPRKRNDASQEHPKVGALNQSQKRGVSSV
jgi:hypothetical protein